jgi:hypothetical protein
VVASKTANATNGGALLLAMGAGVLVLGGGGFTILTWSRRKRAPQQCALERDALEVAEQALRYWQGALAHLQNVAQSQNESAIDNEGDQGSARETQASLLEKATSGHASALQVRDERQLDLIRCMASGVAKSSLRNPYISRRHLTPRSNNSWMRSHWRRISSADIGQIIGSEHYYAPRSSLTR